MCKKLEDFQNSKRTESDVASEIGHSWKEMVTVTERRELLMATRAHTDTRKSKSRVSRVFIG